MHMIDGGHDNENRQTGGNRSTTGQSLIVNKHLQ